MTSRLAETALCLFFVQVHPWLTIACSPQLHNGISLGAIAVIHFKMRISIEATHVTANADDSNNT